MTRAIVWTKEEDAAIISDGKKGIMKKDTAVRLGKHPGAISRRATYLEERRLATSGHF